METKASSDVATIQRGENPMNRPSYKKYQESIETKKKGKKGTKKGTRKRGQATLIYQLSKLSFQKLFEINEQIKILHSTNK